MNKPITTPVEVRLSRVQATDPRRNGKFVLRVEDRVSGCRIAEIELDAEAIANLVSTRSAEGSAELHPHAAERWGKRMEWDSQKLGDRKQDAERMHILARAVVETDGWDTYHLREQRDGWHATFRRWV